MIPRIADRGHSFKGAGTYYLHDKDARTSDRVAWVSTHNLVARTGANALREMIRTAMMADDLKRLNGISLAGRKSSRGEVYAYSLSWPPEQEPTQAQMEEAAQETLQALGLEDHQALLIAHNDTDHDHVHVIVNLVNPDTGRIGSVHNDAHVLSEWAQDYEHRCGYVSCPNRVENNARRAAGEAVKYQEPEAEKQPSIAELYAAAENGSEFKQSLDAIGYSLAKGDRRGFVVVDRAGEVHGLTRQIKDARAREIKAKLSDVDNDDLPSVKAVQEQRRTQQEAKAQEQQETQEQRLSFAEVEAVFDAESKEKREALIHDLDVQYKDRTQEIKREQEIESAIVHKTGLTGFWNALNGRTRKAQDRLALLRRIERGISAKRVAVITEFERQRDYLRDSLAQSDKKRRAYYDQMRHVLDHLGDRSKDLDDNLEVS